MQSTYKLDLHKAARFSRQDGASLLEGIAYLGIAAIVVLGAVSLLTGAFGSARSNQASEELIGLRTAARKLYAGQAYPGQSATVVQHLLRANAVPQTLVPNRVNNTLANSWGGAVTLTGGANNRLTIAYQGVPQDVCMNIVSGANGWVQISNGAQNVAVFPATAANAQAICAAATNNLTFVST